MYSILVFSSFFWVLQLFNYSKSTTYAFKLTAIQSCQPKAIKSQQICCFFCQSALNEIVYKFCISAYRFFFWPKYLKQNCKTTLVFFVFFFICIASFFMAHTCNFMPRFYISLAFLTHLIARRCCCALFCFVLWLCFLACLLLPLQVVEIFSNMPNVDYSLFALLPSPCGVLPPSQNGHFNYAFYKFYYTTLMWKNI